MNKSLPPISNKLHTAESVLFQIHKKAFSDYLKNGEVDNRITQLNFLKLSQLKNEEVDTLKQAYCEDNGLQLERASKILGRLQTQNRQPSPTRFFDPKKSTISSEEQEFMALEAHLKMVLKSKLHTCKIFNGTHLVDPSMEDLRKQDQFRKQGQLKQVMRSSGQSRQLRSQKKQAIGRVMQYDHEGTNNKIRIRMAESEANLNSVLEKYRKVELSKEENRLYDAVRRGDHIELTQWFEQEPEAMRLINIPDEKGLYAIHIAIMRKDAQMFKFLQAHGANMWVLTKKGKSVQQLCGLYQNEEIDALLKNKGK